MCSSDLDGTAWAAGSFQGSVTLGSTTLTSAGGNDVAVAELSKDGQWETAFSAGGTGSDTAQGISAVADGSIAILGYMGPNAVFGEHTIATGNQYVAKYLATPSAPLNVTATPGDHSATISWDALPGGSVTSYVVTAGPGGEIGRAHV